MKNITIAAVILVLLASFASYNVWRANRDPIVAQPSALDLGQQQLHAQLERSEQREAEIERQDWTSVTLLRDLIKAHQQRIDQLSGNSQAGEILAHDHEAVVRIQTRINDLIAQEAARPPAPDQNPAQIEHAAPDEKQ